MLRPVPTTVYHFTHVSHLPTLFDRGLLSDAAAQNEGLVRAEVGNQEIKLRRRRRLVPVPPGGVVADYVPFYFAPRSPMMYAIHRGAVTTYTQGCDDLVYVVTTIEALRDLDVPLVFTDRNAVLGVAAFTGDPDLLDGLIDWPLMRARMWNNTPEQLDRTERRMAECLAYGRVPCDAFTEIVAKTPGCARRVLAAEATVGLSTPVIVRPGWYF